jgi:hypothetical protein
MRVPLTLLFPLRARLSIVKVFAISLVYQKFLVAFNLGTRPAVGICAKQFSRAVRVFYGIKSDIWILVGRADLNFFFDRLFAILPLLLQCKRGIAKVYF